MGKIAVIGSYVTDLTTRVKRMPRPGETLIGKQFKTGPGGKGSNQAIAAARLGTNVSLLTKVGNDAFGKEALKNFLNEKIETDYIIVSKNESTGAALITVDDTSENMIVVNLEATGNILIEEVRSFENEISKSDLVLLQLETSLEAVKESIKLAKEYNKLTILNPAPYQDLDLETLSMVDIITPNETEAEELTGVKVFDLSSAKVASEKLHKLGIDTVIITLGKLGAFLSKGEISEIIPGNLVETIDTTGAGDAFNGALAHFLSEDYNIKDACQQANICASIAVTRLGTAPAMVKKEELISYTEA